MTKLAPSAPLPVRVRHVRGRPWRRWLDKDEVLQRGDRHEWSLRPAVEGVLVGDPWTYTRSVAKGRGLKVAAAFAGILLLVRWLRK